MTNNEIIAVARELVFTAPIFKLYAKQKIMNFKYKK